MDNIFQHLPNNLILRIIREADGGRNTHKTCFADSLCAIEEARSTAATAVRREYEHIKFSGRRHALLVWHDVRVVPTDLVVLGRPAVAGDDLSNSELWWCKFWDNLPLRHQHRAILHRYDMKNFPGGMDSVRLKAVCRSTGAQVSGVACTINQFVAMTADRDILLGSGQLSWWSLAVVCSGPMLQSDNLVSGSLERYRLRDAGRISR